MLTAGLSNPFFFPGTTERRNKKGTFDRIFGKRHFHRRQVLFIDTGNDTEAG